MILEWTFKALVIGNALILLGVTLWLIYYYRHDQRFPHILRIALSYLGLWLGTVYGVMMELWEPISLRNLYYAAVYILGDFGIIALLRWRFQSDAAGKFRRKI